MLVRIWRSDAQYKWSHLSINVQIVALHAAASTAGFGLRAAKLALIIAAVRGTLWPAVVQVAAAPSHLRVV